MRLWTGARRRRAAWIAAMVLSYLASALSTAGAAFTGANGRIAFVSVSANGTSVIVMALNGSGKRMLRGLKYPLWPSWSPEGTRLALVEGADPHLAVVRADGSRRRVIARRIAQAAQPESPTWSPHGTRIAFDFAFGTSVEHRSAVYVVGAGGGRPRRLTDPALGGRQPSWSPRGSTIAFAAKDGLYTMRADGRRARRIYSWTLGYENGDPDFSPDGSRIVFDAPGPTCPDAGSCGTFEQAIYMVDTDGSNPHLVSPRCFREPVWSPDGSKILCEPGYVMDPDGTHAKVVHFDRAHSAMLEPSWQPLRPAKLPGGSRPSPWRSEEPPASSPVTRTPLGYVL